MNDNIIRGTITNTESGESWEREHYLLETGFELTTIVKITQVDSYVHEDDSFQVSVDCLALDSVGSVFSLNMDFTPESLGERDRLLQDFKLGYLFLVKGEYGVIKDEDSPHCIYLSWPSYRGVEPEFSEEEIRKAFEINTKNQTSLKKTGPLREN
jgi:hypothetical protein